MIQTGPSRENVETSALTQPFEDGLRAKKLMFLRCGGCGNAFLPAREECPVCLSDGLVWETASGVARLVSWVVYHRAFGGIEPISLPYTVAIVALEEGPRMISNIVGIVDPEALVIDQPLLLVIEEEGGSTIPRFSPHQTASRADDRRCRG